MKKILVMSDTHGHKGAIAAAFALCSGADCIVHLGDYSQDTAYIRTLTDKPIYAVRGNCDISSSAPSEQTLNIENVRLLAVHGHRQSVKMSLLRLGLYALEKEVHIALYGHTHLPSEQFYEGVMLYNPGSLGEPRGKWPTFGVITIDGSAFRITTQHI